MKNCQFCAEEIQNNAIKCKHCGENQVKPQQSKQFESQTSVPQDILINASFWKVHKIKNPKQYGGWSKGMVFWSIIPIIGIPIAIFGLNSYSVVKNAQAKVMIFASLLFALWGIMQTL